ncbi:Sec63, partial [Borealophlyctis nickersoniae]
MGDLLSPTALNSDDNLVVSAPTGSGKTVIMELAIIRLLMRPDGDNAKVVYMAPTKALCNERTKDWQKKFRTLGLTCNELTGDTNYGQMYEIQRSNIIVTTPEKWDSMTRRWRDYKNLMGLMRLFMIDEVHMLNEAGRGATLEVVVSRMQTVSHELESQQQKASGTGIRLLALSATVPNVADIAIVFGEEFRPVQLQKEVIGYPGNPNNPFVFEKLMEVMNRHSHNKPTLIFCATRKSVMGAAEHLVAECIQLAGSGTMWGAAHPFIKTRDHMEKLRSIKSRLNDKKLAETVAHGIAFHHGGMSYSDRHLIESSFLDGIILVICTTSTLAVGVNLPAHLVIIKSTQHYVNNQYCEYQELDLMQMLGRAGRPQFDDSGVAVIMTTLEKKDKYEAMVSGTETIESSLHDNLIEHLNAEVVLGTIGNVNLAIEWLKSSFLYVRIKKNPSRYKLKNTGQAEGRLSAENRLETICLKDLELLHKNQLIVMSDDKTRVEPTEYGKAMAKYYLKYQTAVTVVQMQAKADLKCVLETLCKAEEFSDIRFHMDKAHLNALNKNPGMRYPIKGRISNIDQKVNVLIQCALGTIPFTEAKSAPQMANETSMIMQHASRIARFIIDICQAKQDMVSLRSALDLCRCIHAKTWENSALLTKQIESVGPALAQMLANAGITSFKKLAATDARHIEFTVNRHPPFGNRVLDWVKGLPQFKMSISQFKEFGKPTEIELYVSVGLENAGAARTYGKRGQYSAVFLAGTSDHVFIDCRRFLLKEGQSFRIRTTLTKPSQRIICSLLCEDIVGVDINQEIIPDIKPMHFRNILRNAPPVTKPPAPAPKQAVNAIPTNMEEDWGPDIVFEDDDFPDLKTLSTTAGKKSASSPNSETNYDDICGGIEWDDLDMDTLLVQDDDPVPPLPPPIDFNASSSGNRPQQQGPPARQQPKQPNQQQRQRQVQGQQDHQNQQQQQRLDYDDDDEDILLGLSANVVRYKGGAISYDGAGLTPPQGQNLDDKTGNTAPASGVPRKVARKRKTAASNATEAEDYGASTEAPPKKRKQKSQKRGDSPDNEGVTVPNSNASDFEDFEQQPSKPTRRNTLKSISTSYRISSSPTWTDDGRDTWTDDGRDLHDDGRPVDVRSFVDDEAMEDEDADEEIEGEFDGWLVRDSEPLSEVEESQPKLNTAEEREDARSDSDSLVNETPLKRLKKKRKMVLSSDEENEEVPIDASPSARAAANKSLQHVLHRSDPFSTHLPQKSDLEKLNDLHDKASTNSLAPWSPAKAALLSQKSETTPRSSQNTFSQPHPSMSSTLVPRTGESRQSFTTRKLMAQPDPFAFPPDPPKPRGNNAHAPLEALNRLHERTSGSGRPTRPTTAVSTPPPSRPRFAMGPPLTFDDASPSPSPPKLPTAKGLQRGASLPDIQVPKAPAQRPTTQLRRAASAVEGFGIFTSRGDNPAPRPPRPALAPTPTPTPAATPAPAQPPPPAQSALDAARQ